MVHQDQGGVIMPLRTAPQWPPRQSMGGGQSSTQSFMARCAKAGGRSVEWPPRCEDLYGSHPVLNSSSLFSAAPGDQVAAPPVPPRPSYYPLRKAHSSAPNLFDAAQKPPRPPPVKDSRKLASKQGGQSVQEPEEDIRELISEDLPPLSTSPDTTLPLEDQPQQKKQRQPPAMSSSQIPGEEPNLTTVYPSNFKLRNEMPVQQERQPVVASQPAFKMTKPIKMRGDNKWPPANAGPEDTVQQEVREFIKPKKQCKDYSGFFAQNALSSNYTGYRAPPGTQHVGSSEEVEGTSEM